MTTDQEILFQIFNITKARMTKKWSELNIKDIPTDKEIWGQIRVKTIVYLENATEDCDKALINRYAKRLKFIDKKLKKMQ